MFVAVRSDYSAAQRRTESLFEERLANLERMKCFLRF